MIFGGQDHVGGLDVPVNEPLLVGHLERRGDLSGGPRRPSGLQRTLVVNQRAELGALHPPRDDVDGSVLLACLIQRDDVGVVERGHRSGLAAQTLPNHGVARHLGLDQLERDGPVEPQLASAVEDPDPAEADDALDLVSGKCGAGSEHLPRGRARRSARSEKARSTRRTRVSLCGQLARRRASRTAP